MTNKKNFKYSGEFSFNFGGTAWHLFYDGDIDAWNISSFKIKNIYIKIDEKSSKLTLTTLYVPDDSCHYDISDAFEENDLYYSAYSASIEAKRRNNESYQIPKFNRCSGTLIHKCKF